MDLCKKLTNSESQFNTKDSCSKNCDFLCGNKITSQNTYIEYKFSIFNLFLFLGNKTI